MAANGLKVGLFTSPHLLDFRERIKIICSDTFSLVDKSFVFDFVSKKNLTGLSFFEITTAMAFEYFAELNVDAAVIETGLGGRLDSTNIVSPVLSIITSIGLDHCALLGNDLASIAREKAGIIKPGVPVIVQQYDEQTAPVFEEISGAQQSNLIWASELDVPYDDEQLQCFDLNGPYQLQNIRTALKAMELLAIPAKLEAISRAASITGLRARWEIVQTANPQIICDIGHNPSALSINFDKLVKMGRPLFIVYGVMADKDYQAVRKLMPIDAKYYAVAACSERALSVDKLAELLDGLDFISTSSVAEGAQMAIEAASQVADSVVYIGGSNFVVAEFLAAIDDIYQ